MLKHNEVSVEMLKVINSEYVATVSLDRPTAHNALNRLMVAEIARVAAALDADPQVHVIIIKGQGKSFCAGLDLKESLPTDLDTLLAEGFGDREALFRVRKPVIAAVSGAAFGAGLELALMCDLILCDSTAAFSMPEVTRGGMPGAGGTQRLTRLVGRMRSTELCLTGRKVHAEESVRIGLCLQSYENSESLMEAALALAKQIAKARMTPLLLIKQACRSQDELSLGAGLALERLSSYTCIASRQPQLAPST